MFSRFCTDQFYKVLVYYPNTSTDRTSLADQLWISVGFSKDPDVLASELSRGALLINKRLFSEAPVMWRKRVPAFIWEKKDPFANL